MTEASDLAGHGSTCPDDLKELVSCVPIAPRKSSACGEQLRSASPVLTCERMEQMITLFERGHARTRGFEEAVGCARCEYVGVVAQCVVTTSATP
jgi:hypothetical protein